MIKIVVDAMGGDNGSSIVVEAVSKAVAAKAVEQGVIRK